jgi:ribosomal protein S25
MHLSESCVRRHVQALITQGELTKDQEGRIIMATATKTPAKKAAAKPKAEKAVAEPKTPRTGQRDHTQDRDGKVLAAITKTKDKGVTKAALAEALGVTESFTYLSLHRLMKVGKVSKSVVEGSRTPVYVAV